MTRVYPRACGGTSARILVAASQGGLSPRLRGNLPNWPLHAGHRRSIPAPAGEPSRPHPRRQPTAVYPRACGGTPIVGTGIDAVLGLSPRLRGNRVQYLRDGLPIGSIPAPAGEPSMSAIARCLSRVYPRACGGTISPLVRATLNVGLSPRLRGNRRRYSSQHSSRRSIPAPAGEPRGCGVCLVAGGVYPRACGGTTNRPVSGSRVSGLSPRLRGNQLRTRNVQRRIGSIPAPAGEPLRP